MREQVLVETIEAVLAVVPDATEFLIVDQTPSHSPEVEQRLQTLAEARRIRRIRLSEPSITKAMNTALREARSDIVLFLDDDLIPESELIESHLARHAETHTHLVAGRVIQPWQEGQDYSEDTEFHFAVPHKCTISKFMGGNFSIKRDKAIALGGFDENFVKVAYNFEAEFAYRWTKAGFRIEYEPAACIHHLQAKSGGTRAYGRHLQTVRPDHAVGAYYHIFRTWDGVKSLSTLLRRPFRAISTRHHLKRPWWVPMTLFAEVRACALAARLAINGPKYIRGGAVAQEVGVEQ